MKTLVSFPDCVREVSLKFRKVETMKGCAGEKVDDVSRVIDYVKSAYEENPQQEVFVVVMTDTKFNPISRQIITT